MARGTGHVHDRLVMKAPMAIDPSHIIGRDAARALGLRHYFTGEPCLHGHIAERHVSSGDCLECNLARVTKWNAANSEKVRARGREYFHKRRAADPEWYEEIQERYRKHRAANLEEWRKKERERSAKSRAKNKDKVRSKQAARRAANKNRRSPTA
jgi:hypothetical protein